MQTDTSVICCSCDMAGRWRLRSFNAMAATRTACARGSKAPRTTLGTAGRTVWSRWVAPRAQRMVTSGHARWCSPCGSTSEHAPETPEQPEPTTRGVAVVGAVRRIDQWQVILCATVHTIVRPDVTIIRSVMLVIPRHAVKPTLPVSVTSLRGFVEPKLNFQSFRGAAKRSPPS